MIGYKLLRSDLSSLSDQYGRHKYSAEWTHVPGNGAYVALTLPGLLRGGMGEVFAQVEYKSPTGKVNDGEVVTARRVRILRYAPVDIWAVVRAATWGARQVLPPKGHPLRPVCLQAVKAAEECERERTLAAAAVVDAAVRAADGAAVWAAMWAAEAAKRASAWSSEIAADASAEAAVSAAEWTAKASADAASGAALARRLLDQFVDQVLPPPLRLRRKGG